MLIFVSNELTSRNMQERLNVPMQFVCFALIEAKMYRHYRSRNTFCLPNKTGTTYGAVYTLKDAFFHIRTLDAYHACSMDILKRNHTLDLHHRVEIPVIPIKVKCIDDWERLKYLEQGTVPMQAYIGNLTHPNISQRLDKTNSYRIKDGINQNLRELIQEELS